MSKIEWTADQVTAKFKELGVSSKRLDAMEAKFVTIPDSGTFTDIGVIDLVLNKGKVNEKTLPNQPVVFLDNSKTKYILVGYLSAKYTDKADKPSIISADNGNKGKFLVVNNKNVQLFGEGLSESEIVSFLMNKAFKAKPAKDYLQFSPTFDEAGKVSFFDTEKEATEACKIKSYRNLVIAD